MVLQIRCAGNIGGRSLTIAVMMHRLNRLLKNAPFTLRKACSEHTVLLRLAQDERCVEELRANRASLISLVFCRSW